MPTISNAARNTVRDCLEAEQRVLDAESTRLRLDLADLRERDLTPSDYRDASLAISDRARVIAIACERAAIYASLLGDQEFE